ncbi:MAG: acyl carrier protein [Candidatus Zixiibacteriota bacterium]|nr:MAG: acyl carrier protein [candidate division Zixibacteria bacterium]
MTTTDTATIRNKLRQFIAETFFIGEGSDDLADADSFMENGVIDSTGILELTSFLEERFEITVEDDDMIPDNLDSIDNLVRYLGSKAV